MDDARRLSGLLKTLDDAVEFGASFAEPSEKNRGFILFEDIVAATNIDGEGSRGGWEGRIRIPRDIATEMMQWLERRVSDEMKRLGVTSPDPTNE